MPKGFHYNRQRTRRYTGEYPRISAKSLKGLLQSPLGSYSLAYPNLPSCLNRFTLKEHELGVRYLEFETEKHTLEIGLICCNKSASSKLYLTCPFCQTNRQNLYIFKNGLACRQCLNLHYPSQSERKLERIGRRIRKLRRTLWGNMVDLDNLFELSSYFPKPKYMRWKTFEQKRNVIINLESEYWAAWSDHFRKSWGDLKHLADMM